MEKILTKDSGFNNYSEYELASSSIRLYIYNRTRSRHIYYDFFNYDCTIDEVRLSRGALYKSNYIPSTQPFITNTVLVPPQEGTENKVAFKTNYGISNLRVGGVKPTYPSDGYVYVYLEDDVVKSIQQYQSNAWYEIDGSIYKNGEWTAMKESDLSYLKVDSPDSGTSGGLKPPDNPGISANDPDRPGDSGNTGDYSGLWDGILSFIKKIGGFFIGLFNILLEGISGLLSSFTNLITSLTDSVGVFSNFLSGMFGFVPAELWAAVTSGITLIIIISVIKFLRG